MPKKKKIDDRPRRSGQSAQPRVAVNSYYGNRKPAADVVSPFEKKKVKKSYQRLIVRGVDLVFFITITVVFVLSLIVKPGVQVILSDSTYHPKQYYAAFINSQISKLTNRNKITFDEQGIKSQIIKAFPEITSSSIELPILGQTPKVSLGVAQPAFFLSSGSDEYLLSANGVAVDLKSYYHNLADLPTIDDQSGFTILKGKHVLSLQDVTFLQTITAEVKKQNVPVKNFVLPKIPEEVELYTADAPYYTRFYMGGDSVAQVGQYLAAHNKFKSGGGPSQYLDVRVSGKVFYK